MAVAPTRVAKDGVARPTRVKGVTIVVARSTLCRLRRPLFSRVGKCRRRMFASRCQRRFRASPTRLVAGLHAAPGRRRPRPSRTIRRSTRLPRPTCVVTIGLRRPSFSRVGRCRRRMLASPCQRLSRFSPTSLAAGIPVAKATHARTAAHRSAHRRSFRHPHPCVATCRKFSAWNARWRRPANVKRRKSCGSRKRQDPRRKSGCRARHRCVKCRSSGSNSPARPHRSSGRRHQHRRRCRSNGLNRRVHRCKNSGRLRRLPPPCRSRNSGLSRSARWLRKGARRMIRVAATTTSVADVKA